MTNNNTINNNIHELFHPEFLILLESTSTPITRQNISATFSDSKYEVPECLTEEITRPVESIKGYSKEDGFEFFDDIVARLDDWHFNRGYGDHGDGKLILNFSETTHYDFAAMNLGFIEPVKTVDNNRGHYHGNEKEPILRDLLNEEPNKLNSSKLPNRLSVNMSVAANIIR